MRALITGATGTIGRALDARLDGETVIVSRDPAAARRAFPGSATVAWSGRDELPASAFDGVDAVFHLAGEPIADGRWTSEKRDRIRSSRVDGTRALVRSLARAPRRPRVLVAASAVGIYGSRGDEVLTESSPTGDGFLADVCRQWEAESSAAAELGIRVVHARIGIVLAREGGALARMLPLFRVGAAGKIGTGEQWMPWVHVEDVVFLLAHAAANEALSGPLNVVAPAPVTNADFTAALASAVHRPAVFRAPAPLLRLALGDMASVVLASQRVVPERAVASGFAFAFPTVNDALADLCGAVPSRAIA